tara:strand:+ start:913 stop:1392 length:480 start_codon:yes stop_codon:yes gene_type:complete
MWSLLISLVISALFFIVPSQGLFALRTMDYSKQALIEADLSNQDLSGVTFNLTNLLKANLSGSNLEGASLFRAKLQEADLSNANLKGVTLDSAVLEGTNLENAILEDAFAFDTKFTDVNIYGTDFTNIMMDIETTKKLCKYAEGSNSLTGKNTKDSLGC